MVIRRRVVALCPDRRECGKRSLDLAEGKRPHPLHGGAVDGDPRRAEAGVEEELANERDRRRRAA